MERAAELSEKALTLLFQNYMLWLGVLVLILLFAIYIYLVPSAPMEGFTSNPRNQENTRKHQ